MGMHTLIRETLRTDRRWWFRAPLVRAVHAGLSFLSRSGEGGSYLVATISEGRVGSGTDDGFRSRTLTVERRWIRFTAGRTLSP